MKPVCALLVSVWLAAFAPPQGQSYLTCRSVDATNGESLELTTEFTRIDNLFMVISDVRVDGKFDGREIHRTFPASSFQMNMQIDRDGQRRLAFHSRSGVDDRLRWFIRDGAGVDAFDFDFPAKLGVTGASGRFPGTLGASKDAPPPSRSAECSSRPDPKY